MIFGTVQSSENQYCISQITAIFQIFGLDNG